MDYFIMEMWSGIWTLRNTIPLSGFIFLGVICIELLIKFIQKKKINFKEKYKNGKQCKKND